MLLVQQGPVEGLGVGRRVDAELLGEQVAGPAVGAERLAAVAGHPVGLHEQDVAGVAVRLQGDQLLGRLDRHPQLTAADGRARDGVEGADPQGEEPAADSVDPLALGAHEERLGGDGLGHDRLGQGPVGVATGDGRLRRLDRRRRQLDVDDDVGGQAELVATELAGQHLGGGQVGGGQEGPDPAHDGAHGRLPRRRQGVGPQRLGQLVAVDGAATLEHQQGEGEAGTRPTEAGLVDQLAARLDRDPAGERDPHRHGRAGLSHHPCPHISRQRATGAADFAYARAHPRRGRRGHVGNGSPAPSSTAAGDPFRPAFPSVLAQPRAFFGTYRRRAIAALPGCNCNRGLRPSPGDGRGGCHPRRMRGRRVACPRWRSTSSRPSH